MERFLDFLKPRIHLWALLCPFYWSKWHIFLPFYILQLEKSLPSHASEAWKRHPCREKGSSISHHREYPPKTQSVVCLFAKKIEENFLQVQRRRKNVHFLWDWTATCIPMRTKDSQYSQYEAWKTRLARGLRLEQISIHAPLTVVSRQMHKRKMG